mmetsp:Transcript_8214/g.16929  ORF Transcript_8214/g.16929 Transcript_8214/m.16929 type:complete len:332 (-) Transcript_8214:134-1129(-)|eukprot:CAMPEP_0118921728 /NCGR_PEP_ID=MMETSP1169-20130426/914_1 /TAXON_ID=36882 /ORGANISM="Pyramimonas obovata, Strain CCMP722" /LENGTH=331 /DNA_ID=CAMNT_0006862501 /DNA_START=201 /DNA_END=1196 /DNA_ORIENTATION=-
MLRLAARSVFARRAADDFRLLGSRTHAYKPFSTDAEEPEGPKVSSEEEIVTKEWEMPSGRAVVMPAAEPQRLPGKMTAPSDVASKIPAPPAVPPPLPFFVRKPPKQLLRLSEALRLVKDNSKAKFDETVEIAIQLGVDPKRSDQIVRGLAVLPNGTGKKTRVAVFARGAEADEALAAGADVVGAEELIAKIKSGGSGAINFDRAIGHPSLMPQLSQVARILGPRGLMPNPKLGTLTTDITKAVKLAKQGQVEFRGDKSAIIHASVGKVSFTAEHLEENIAALLDALYTAKPKTLKGVQAGSGYITGAHLASTMGSSVQISKESIVAKTTLK